MESLIAISECEIEGRSMSNIEEYYYLSATEFELKIHRELECPSQYWLELNYPELFRPLPIVLSNSPAKAIG